ncbi:hypothetical protein BT69DRAFT_1258124 [Atractiella rhizophila]|nr:hypothetical protein BT69DRAFT_1258124 [Atractiella rhizophila]
MSSNSTLPSLLGGYPTKNPDTAASVVFAIAFGILFPFALYRFINHASRSKYLLLVIAFIIIRIGSFVVRIIIAEHNGEESTGVIVAEQVLLSIGYLPLIKIFLDLFFRYALVSMVQASHTSKPQTMELPSWSNGGTQLVGGMSGVASSNKDFLRRAAGWIATQAIQASIICAIVAATKYSEPNERSTVKTLRFVSSLCAFLVLATVLFLILILLAFMSSNKSYGSRRSTIVVLIGSALLVVIPSYKLATQNNTDLFSRKIKAELYLLQILPELLTTTLLLLCNLKTDFDMELIDQEDEQWMNAKYPNGRSKILKRLGAGYF